VAAVQPVSADEQASNPPSFGDGREGLTAFGSHALDCLIFDIASIPQYRCFICEGKGHECVLMLCVRMYMHKVALM
jgi:hypothetical protein